MKNMNFALLKHKRIYKQICTYLHYVKSVRIRSFSGPYFPAFGLNMDSYGVSLCIQSKCGKIGTRKTPNMDTFHAVLSFKLLFDNY